MTLESSLQVLVEYDAYHPRPGIRVTFGDTFPKEQADALARLIAAAPEMLALLKDLKAGRMEGWVLRISQLEARIENG